MIKKNSLVVVLMPLTGILFSGCFSIRQPLRQEYSSVKVAPISVKHKLDKKPEGKIVILLGKAGTGLENYNNLLSNSLARTLMDKNGLNISVVSFQDFVNLLKEKGVYNEYASTWKSYGENGVFGPEIENLGKKLGIDYFFVPRILQFLRWDERRVSVGGFGLVHTNKISLGVELQIWSLEGYIVFDGTADVMVTDEALSLSSKPLFMEEVFEKAWLIIMKELKKEEKPEEKK